MKNLLLLIVLTVSLGISAQDGIKAQSDTTKAIIVLIDPLSTGSFMHYEGDDTRYYQMMYIKGYYVEMWNDAFLLNSNMHPISDKFIIYDYILIEEN